MANPNGRYLYSMNSVPSLCKFLKGNIKILRKIFAIIYAKKVSSCTKFCFSQLFEQDNDSDSLSTENLLR